MNLQYRAAMTDLIEEVEIEQPTPAPAVVRASTNRDQSYLLDADLHGDELEMMQDLEEQQFAAEVNAARRRSTGHMLRNKDYWI